MDDMKVLEWAKSREKNIHQDHYLSEDPGGLPLLRFYYSFKTKMFLDCQKFDMQNKPAILEYILTQAFLEVKAGIPPLNQEQWRPDILISIQEACAFTGLAMFLHTTNKLPGMKGKDFVLNYFQRYKELSPIEICNQIDSDVNLLRKYKNNELSRRPVYTKERNEWKLFAQDMLHEWSLYELLNQGPKTALSETFWRFRNLGKPLEKVFPKYDTEEQLRQAAPAVMAKELDDAYRKYESKLKKIKYENYLDLIKLFLDHLEKDKEFYGNNLYRLEKELFPYILTHQVNQFLRLSDEKEKDIFLTHLYFLDSVTFPRVYEELLQISDYDLICNYLHIFKFIRNHLTPLLSYVLDELVEEDIDGWMECIKDNVNQRAKMLFYSPDEIDWTVQEGSQEAFETCLSYPVFKKIQDLKFKGAVFRKLDQPGQEGSACIHTTLPTDEGSTNLH